MKYDTQNPNAGKIRRSLSTKTAAAVLALLSLCYGASADGSDKPFRGPKDWSFYASGGPVTLPPQETNTTAIDVGRQLFVDDYLISETTLVRSFHKLHLSDRNPMLKPETELELDGGDVPIAAPFPGGAWYDPQDNLFKLWYLAGWRGAICYAESKDGMTWNRPSLDVVPGSNRVLPIRTSEDGHIWGSGDTTVWLDLNATDPAERYKMSVFSRRVGVKNDEGAATIYTSPDGIHWKNIPVVEHMEGNEEAGWYGGDNTTFYYDPFRKLWVSSIRERPITLDALYKGGLSPGEKKMAPNDTIQSRFYYANPDWLKSYTERKKSDVIPSSPDKNPPYLRADDLDRWSDGTEAGLSDFMGNAYESLEIGAFCILAHPAGAKNGGPNPWDIEIGYSRDGYHWERPTRTPIIASSRVSNTWNRGYLHPASGVCLVVGDELYFYLGAWSGESPNKGVAEYAGGTTVLATLRRDGFASMDAGETPGTLTTTPISFQGKYPFVNVKDETGELRMEVLDVAGNVIAPFSLANSVPVKTDSTRQRITWTGGADLSTLAGKAVRFRFELTQGKLYSFWVSPDTSGASYGYVAAGGPGFTGPIDTVGGK